MDQIKISKKDQHGVMESFWTMMKNLEIVADNENDPVMKNMVEGFFRQWNRIADDTSTPIWDKRVN